MNKQLSNLPQLMSNTINVVKEVGAFIRKAGKTELHVEEKSRNSLVTYVDKESEIRLVKMLLELVPNAGILGEEGVANTDNKELNWIIDPVDGTTNFIHQIPCFSVSVALVQNNTTLVGVVYEINLDECFSAYKGGGAFLNNESICTSKTPELKDTLLATGFPYYDYGNMESYLALLSELMQKTRGLRRLGSAAVDLAYVACGRFDGFYEYNLNAWDVAAGALIVQEAGGKVTDFDGGDNYLFGKEIMAASAPISEELLKIIQSYFKSN